METLYQDVRVAVRGLAKRPGFFAVTVFTLALGMGATTAIYSVVHGVLLAPLGYTDEERLVAMSSVNPAEGLELRGNFLPDFWFWREHTRAFDEMAFFGWRSWTLQEPDRVERIESVAVSANLFRMLGLEPVLGRNFEAADEVAGPGHVALISHGLWRRAFGGDENVIGRTVTLSETPVTIIGVMPPETNLPSSEAELWRPVGYLEGYEQSAFGREERDFRVIARLSDGVDITEARAEMERMSEELAERFPPTNAGWDVRVQSLREHLVGGARTALLVAFAAVGCVLLIACTNVANLVLVRAMDREREVAVQTALGAGRRRLIQSRIAETLVLTLSGGAVGLVLAAWLRWILLSYEPGILPLREAIAFDVPVLLFALAVSVAIGTVLGLASLFHRVPSLTAALKEGGAQVGGSTRQNRVRMTLLASQIALTLAILVGAGLLTEALYELSRVDPGFRPDGVYGSHIVLGAAYQVTEASDPDEVLESRRRYFKRLVDDVRALPGVSHAALTTTPPVPGWGVKIDVPYRGLDGPLVSEPGAPRAAFRVIGPGYFETIGTPLVRGREFTDRDRADTRPVVIVNESLARRAFGDENPVGRELSIFLFGESMTFEVIGVSANTRFAGLDQPPRPALFLPHPQMPFLGMGVVARTNLGPASYSEVIRRTALAIDPSHPVLYVVSLEEALAGTLAMERFYSVLLGVFAIVALVLSASGVYGVFSYWVSQRRREMGLRIALGAGPGDVVRLIVSHGLRVALPGIVVGGGASIVVAKVLATTFRGVRSLDPLVMGLAVAVLAAVAIAACLLPARQAASVQPSVALRAE